MQKFHQQSLTFLIEKKADAYIGRIEEMPDLTPVVGSNINLVRYQLCLRLAHATHLWPENSEIGTDQAEVNAKPQAPHSGYPVAS